MHQYLYLQLLILLQFADALIDPVQWTCASPWQVPWNYKQSSLRCVAHGVNPSSFPGILDIWCAGFCLIDVVSLFHPHHAINLLLFSHVNLAVSENKPVSHH